MAAGNGATNGTGTPALVDVRALRQKLSEARGKRKLNLLFDQPDPKRAVRALPAEDLYFALLDIGPDDAAELVAMATPEQFRYFVDMAAWPRTDEGPRTAEVVRWLRLARVGGEEDEGDLRRYRKQLSMLDRELLALVLRREVEVHDLAENEDPPQPKDPANAYYTPDRRFLLELSGSSGYGPIRQVIDDLYAEDPFGASALIEATRWEVPTELEENARRWRDGRLRDLGVPDLPEALSFFARPARAAAPLPAPAAGSALLAPERNLLDAALAQLSPDELDQVEEGLTYAANATLVAARIALDDADDVREQLAAARSTISLGLELLSGGEPVRAARLLAERHIRDIFQAAMGELYRLQTRGRRVAQEARLPQAKTATLLEPPLAPVVDALLHRVPRFAEPGGPRRARAFASRHDLARAEALLDEAEAELGILGALGLSPAALSARLDEAQLAPSAVRASDALWAFVECRLRGESFSLARLRDEGRPRSPGFERELEALLVEGVRSASTRSDPATVERAAQRLRTLLSG